MTASRHTSSKRRETSPVCLSSPTSGIRRRAPNVPRRRYTTDSGVEMRRLSIGDFYKIRPDLRPANDNATDEPQGKEE